MNKENNWTAVLGNKKTPNPFQVKDLDQYRRTVLDTMVDGLVVINDKGTVLNVNKACAELFGYSEQEIIGKSIKMLMTKHDQDHYNNYLEKQLKTGLAKVIGKDPHEVTGRRKDGSEIALELSVNFHEEDGETIFVGSLRNITKRKETEAAFKDLQEKLQLITDNTTDIIALRDPTGKFLYVSPSFGRLLRYNFKTNMEKISLEDILHPDDREPYITNWKQTVFGKGAPFRAEARLRAADGEYLWFEGQSQPIKNEHGEVTAAVTVAREITDRKKTETSFKELQEKLKLVTDNTNDIIALRDPTGKALYLSPSFERQLKYNIKKYQGKISLEDILHPDDREPYITNWKKTVFELGRPFSAAIRLRAADGEYLWFEGQSQPIKNEHGEVTAAVTVAREITDRKKAEAAFKELQNKLKLITDNATDIINLRDATGKLLYVTPSAERQLKYKKEDFIGNLRWQDIIHPDDQDTYLSLWKKRVLVEGKPLTAEMRMKTSEGKYLWYESNNRPVKNEAGEVEYVVTVARNITERKEAEETLRKHEQFLETTLETMVDGLVVINEKGIALSINHACADIFGYTEEEIVGKNINKLMHGDDKKHHDGYIAHYLKTGKAKIIGRGPREVTGRKKDGSDVALELSVNSHKEEDGGTIFVASLRDITQRKEAEAAFRELQEKLHLITENATDIISLRDSTGKMVYLSPSFERQLQYDPREYMAQAAWKTVMHPDDREVFMKNWKDTVFEKGRPYTSEHRLRTAEGNYLWFESQSRPVKNEAGEVIAAVTISRNITEQRKMEEKLRQAKKMEAVGQLTGGVAHEFNNILTTILASLKVFETLEMKEDERECLNFTIEAAKRGAALTDHLLKFSRKEKLEPETLNPNALFKEINPVLEITVGKNITYKFQPARENMCIHVDRNELEDALLGLCNNAKEATEQAGGSVNVKVSSVKITKGSKTSKNVPPGDYCRISVSDTGSGMSEEVLERALDPFFTTKSVGEGAGLGLSSVYGFVRQSDGYLKIDSKSGLGTSVHMYFPLVKSKPEMKPSKAAEAQKGKASTATILLVENDDKQTRLASKALGPLAGTVLSARNLAEARKIIKHQPDISLLITQMTIDGEDTGPDLVREFTSKCKKGGILVVAKHPDKARTVIKKSSRVGDVLASPYSLSSLITKTDNLLKTLNL